MNATTPASLRMPSQAHDLALMVPRGAALVLVRILVLAKGDLAEASALAHRYATNHAGDPRYALLAGILDEAAGSASLPKGPSA